MINKWYFDHEFHSKIPNQIANHLKKRPRRAIRKLFRGLSHKKVMSIPAWIHRVQTHEQNKYSSAMQTCRWSSHFKREWNLPNPILKLMQYRFTVWRESPYLLLALMFGVSIHQMLKLLFAHMVSRTKAKGRYAISRYNKFLLEVSNLLYDTSSPNKICIQMRTRKMHQQSTHHTSKLWSRSQYIFVTVYNLDKKPSKIDQASVYFDSDTNFVICNNSANVHVCNDKRMFMNLWDIKQPQVVATIGGKNSKPTGIGSVKWTWNDDEGASHTYIMNVLYFPSSPVDILSISEFANQLKDDEGTGIDSK